MKNDNYNRITHIYIHIYLFKNLESSRWYYLQHNFSTNVVVDSDNEFQLSRSKIA